MQKQLGEKLEEEEDDDDGWSVNQSSYFLSIHGRHHCE